MSTHSERLKVRRQALKAAEEAVRESVSDMPVEHTGEVKDDPVLAVLEQINQSCNSIKCLLAKINYREGMKCGEEV